MIDSGGNDGYDGYDGDDGDDTVVTGDSNDTETPAGAAETVDGHGAEHTAGRETEDVNGGKHGGMEHTSVTSAGGKETETSFGAIEKESPYFTDIKQEAIHSFETAKASYAKEYGAYMPASSKERLSSVTPEKNMEVLTEKQYNERNPGSKPNVLGHAKENGSMEIKGLSEDQVRHTTFHEMGHISSFFSKNVEKTDGTNGEKGNTVEKIQTGVKTKSFTYSSSGEKIHSATKIENAALNEGITEYFTRDVMAKNGMDGEKIPTGYRDALDCVKQLDTLVNSETLKSSYFGGDHSLRDAVNTLGESPQTFEKLSANLDIVTYSKDEAARSQAKFEINETMAKMTAKAEMLERQAKEAAKNEVTKC